MRFVEVLKNKTENNPGTRTPLIAFLGDSVTQGCFEVFEEQGKIRTVFDSLFGYPEKVKKFLSFLYPEAPVSILNASVNGSSAIEGAKRLRRDVLCCKPDLLVVCFGLNDSNQGMEGLEPYENALLQIFADVKEAGVETIFMTPNMLNTYKSRLSEEGIFCSLADVFADRQNQGTFDAYMETARNACKKADVTLCDCYAIWKNLYENGVDTTRLLANGLNHPVREMHDLFAMQLINTILRK